MKGLTHLHQGELEDAEDELQKAARWSQNLEQKMIMLNNLGALTWSKLGRHFCSNLFHSNITYSFPLFSTVNLTCFDHLWLPLSGLTFTERVAAQDTTVIDEVALAWMRRDVLYFGYKAVDGGSVSPDGKDPG